MASGPEWNLGTAQQQLFGREKETALLKKLWSPPSAAEQSTTTATTVILHGPEGSGKSSLVKSQPWKEQGWLFGSGKYEQHHASGGQPFIGLIEALNDLVDQWFEKHGSMEETDDHACCMEELRNLLIKDSEFLQTNLPKIYNLAAETMGEACAKAKQAMAERKKYRQEATASGSFTMKQDLGTIDCINSSFVRIVNFLSQKQPMVMFLDEVHFADQASLGVFQSLATATQATHNFVLALSYRDEDNSAPDEEDPDHSYLTTLEAIRKEVSESEASDSVVVGGEEKDSADDAGDESKTEELPKAPRPSLKKVLDITVGDLDVESVNRFVASVTQRRNLDETMPLARVIHKKTMGNPFFVIQFLRMLRQEDFIRYSVSSFQWEWGDVDKLESVAHVSENVADIVANTMNNSLSESTRVALKVASCFGKIIPQTVLLEWFENFFDKRQVGSTCAQCLQAVQLEGLHNILNDAVKLGILVKPPNTGGQDQQIYMWAHDKLQSVAYSLITKEWRAQLHMKLGRLLWKMSKTHPDEEWMVFMAAEQMNRYSEYRHEDPNAKEVLGAEVAMLCFEAAKLSLSKSALYPAYEMLQGAVRHLSVDKWKDEHYDLSLRLFSTVAELSVQLGKREKACDDVKEVESHAKSFDDKFRAHTVYLKCITSGADRNYQLGAEKSIEYLRDYGVRFPNKLLPGQLFLECKKLGRKLGGNKGEGKNMVALLDLPLMTDKRSKNIMKLLMSHVGPYIYMGQKKGTLHLYWYAGLRALNLTVEKGVCEESAMAVMTLAAAYRTEGYYKEAEEFAEIGIKLLDRFPQTVGSIHAIVLGFIAGGIYSATKPLNKVLDLWLEAHHVGLRTGMTEKAGGAILAYTLTYINVGLPLDPLKMDLVEYEKEAVQFNLPETVLACFKILQQFIFNLQDSDSKDPTVFKGEAMDEDKMLESFKGNALQMTKRDINTFRLILAVIYGKWEVAEKMIDELKSYLDTDQFLVRTGMRRATVALAAFKLSRNGGKRKLRSMAKKILKEAKDALKKGDVNSLPTHTMLEAEESPSKERYDNAIRSCARLGLVHFEAYMCEQAAYYFLEKKDEEWAEFYLAQAFSLYNDWGATAKTHQLRQLYPRLLRSASLRERANTALKGRTRYDSSHTDILKDFDWERLSTSTTSSSGSSRSSFSKSSEEDEEVTEGSSESGSMSGSIRGLMMGSPLS